MSTECSIQASRSAYRPRKAECTVLFGILAEHLETFIQRVDRDGPGLPSFVIRELRRFLECGIRAHGFMRARCAECRYELAVPFSCKGRGFCPSCGGRFMAQTAAHLVDRVRLAFDEGSEHRLPRRSTDPDAPFVATMRHRLSGADDK